MATKSFIIFKFDYVATPLIYLFPYGQFWFLQALFIIFMAVTILEKFEVTTDFKRWSFSFLSAVILLMTVNATYQLKLFNLNGCLYLFPFFLLGMGLQRFSDKILIKPVLPLLLAVFILGLILQQLNWFELVALERQRHGLLSVVVGVTGICLVFYLKRSVTWLAKIGYFSYSIYLFHIFGTAGSRILLRIMGLENTLLLFLGGVFAGVGLSIFVEFILLNNALTRRVFLGLR